MNLDANAVESQVDESPREKDVSSVVPEKKDAVKIKK